MKSDYIKLLIEPAREYESSFQLRMNEFCREYDVDNIYYIKREQEKWEKILIDLQDPVGTHEGYGHILSHEILDQVEKKIDYERLVIETEKKVAFIKGLLENKNTSMQDPRNNETLLRIFSAMKNMQTKAYISEPDITKNLPQSTSDSPLRFFGYLLEAGGFDVVKQLIWRPLEELKMYMNVLNYDSESLVYTTDSQNPDGSIDVFQVDKKLEIIKLLQKKISISKGLIDEKISSLQNRDDVSLFLTRILDELLHYDDKYRNHQLTLRHKFTIDIFTSFLEDLVKKYKSSIDDSKKEEINAHIASLPKLTKVNSKSQKKFNHIYQKDLHEFMSQHQWESFIKALINIDILDSNGNQTEEQLPLYKTIYCLKVQLNEKGYLKESTKQLPAKVIASVHSKIFPSGKEAKIPKINQGHKLTEKQLENIFDLPVYEDPQKK